MLVNNNSISTIADTCDQRSTHLRWFAQSRLLIFTSVKISCNHAQFSLHNTRSSVGSNAHHCGRLLGATRRSVSLERKLINFLGEAVKINGLVLQTIISYKLKIKAKRNHLMSKRKRYTSGMRKKPWGMVSKKYFLLILSSPIAIQTSAWPTPPTPTFQILHATYSCD